MTPVNRVAPAVPATESPDFSERLQKADDLKKLDIVVMEMARECDALEQSRKRYNSSHDASRRVMALGKLGSIIAEKHELLKSEGLDPSSPSVQILVQLILERVKLILQQDLSLGEEQIQLFLTNLPAKMSGWEEEVDRRVKQQLFHLRPNMEPDSVGPTER